MKPWVHRAFAALIVGLWVFSMSLGHLSQVPALFIALLGFAIAGASALFLGLLLHEAAHVVAGLLLGMRFNYMAVTGWRFTRTEKGFQFSGRPFTSGNGAASVQTRSTKWLRERELAVWLAGPVGSLVGLGGGLYLVALESHMRPANAALLVFGAFFSVACAYDLYVSLNPNPVGYRTDAQGVVALARMTPLGKDLLGRTIFRLASETKDEIRVKELLGEMLRDYGRDVSPELLDSCLGIALSKGWNDLADLSEGFLVTLEGEERLTGKSLAAFTFMKCLREPDKAKSYLPNRTDYEESPEPAWFLAATLVAFADREFEASLALAEEALQIEDLPADQQRWFELAKQRSEYRLTDTGRR